MAYYLGLDTSAYTSSLAVVDENYQVLIDKRINLVVKPGNRGLRQSEALFLHLKNLPLLFAELPDGLHKTVKAVAVSAFPRNVPGSYMPVFTAGLTQARVLSLYSGLPLYEVAHQDGHIMAGLHDARELMDAPGFLAVHFSGGTSEVLNVKTTTRGCFSIELLMAGTDLHAGQLVDRVGVAMGLAFPAGKDMEKLALRSSGKNIPAIPSAVNPRGFSFSGPENRALQLLNSGLAHQDLAFAVLRVLANTLEKVLLNSAEKTGQKEVLLVGGVMANTLIRERLIKRLQGMKLYFAAPSLSTDNAVGVAMLACACTGGVIHHR
ncbi:Kae1-like domain-containing protein [Syntrophomonas palmitatica]|uniref:Kae1-like domain-containing protein n=1 Tax=Syntrophomonas palmitatica TaxID=402877 RepID=UPI0006CF6B69|nr:peptidase M22 [Syntrophomonas palmitatica]